MKSRGKFHEIADAVRAKRRQTMKERTMQQITGILPKGVVAQVFAGGIVLVGTGLDTSTFREIMTNIPQRQREAIIGWRRVEVLPRGEA